MSTSSIRGRCHTMLILRGSLLSCHGIMCECVVTANGGWELKPWSSTHVGCVIGAGALGPAEIADPRSLRFATMRLERLKSREDHRMTEMGAEVCVAQRYRPRNTGGQHPVGWC